MATEIGTKIKRARERKRWSQRHLAGLLRVSQKTVDNWENGRTSPRSSIGALEEVLGVRLDDGPQEPEMPTPEELERLKEHIRQVLGPNSAAALEAAMDAALGGEPPRGRSERSEGAEGAEWGRSARKPSG